MSPTGIQLVIREKDIARLAHQLYEERQQLQLRDWYEAEELLRRQISTPGPRRITQETIAEMAYKLWQARVGVVGSAESDWNRATELLEQRHSQAAA